MSVPVEAIQKAAKKAAQQRADAYAAELTRRLHAALKRELEAAQSENPRFLGFNVKQDVFAYPKRPKGWGTMPLRVVKGFVTTRSFLNMTNPRIAEHVGTWFPGHTVNVSIMTKALPKSSWPKIQAELDQARLPITVQDGDTLSTLKRAIRAGGRNAIPSAEKIEVAIGEEYVVVNGQALKIESGRGTDTVRVTVGGKRQHLRVDVLRALQCYSSSI